MQYLIVKKLTEPEYKLDIPSIVKMAEDTHESVSDITGIAIPAYFEYTIKGNTTLISKNLVEN